jgi:riboflavin kinase/FMN adenylyltransferase
MLLIRHIKSASSPGLFPSGCVATIGNFDGLHQGHQAIFEQLKKRAKAAGLPCVVVTFEPLPREYFQRTSDICSSAKSIPTRLMRFKEKWTYLKKMGC